MNKIAMMNSQNYRQRDMVRQSGLCVNIGARIGEKSPFYEDLVYQDSTWLSFLSTLILVTSIS